ncbi:MULTISPECIES: leucyl aminopeptidase [unclassified Treponema]|uniref:cysteinylglycinase n=1 Tax=unclassified Treponema TaxID=2638727 RepID=UPI0020A3D550|nr:MULTISPECIES: leucyl aminopeptidase [unclassified Treponema]UTC66788.1 leucyl aminopeptidase [Treponema sp. OMZ 789]UTC69521.1 leucyl aminopeptidase [Treponema sp. OMZ 790]UTC72235.1 leucyl aminopeptidase [Treponema sp. OMZ 791]
MKFNIAKHGGVAAQLVYEEKIEGEFLTHLKEKELFSGKAEEVYYSLDSNLKAHLFIGLGKEEKIDLEVLRKTFFKASSELLKNKVTEVELNIPKLNNLCTYKTASAIAEGMLHATYQYDKFKSDRKELMEITVNYNPEKGKEDRAEKGIGEAVKLMEAVFLTRDLVNEPPNVIYPETLAQIAKEKLEAKGVKVTIHGKKEIEALKMEAFLSVARASAKEPKLIVMEYYNNPDSKEKIALVGKGLTYDSGGYAIKPATSMVTMFTDMGGSGTVIGTMHALADLKAKVNVVAVVASCENMISGDGFRNGDIIGSMSGKTIEIINTDAEGRLTLADAVYYATNNLGATKLIDLATLTGACVAAFGEQVSGAVTNNDEFFAELVKANERAGEIVWRMPAIEYYKKMNESKVADLKNTGGKSGGMMTAGLFVGSFLAKEDIPWIHIDIAGTAYITENFGYLKEKATGTLVKSLYYMLSKEE